MAVAQERLQAAESRAARAEMTCSNELDLKSRISNLELQLQSWETSASTVGADSPESVADRLTGMHEEILLQTTRLSEQDREKRKLQG